mmetsp:Transcript_92961/g.182160  ORF Transcript_92961/g.182160 Transcript_92961/m.182160 type:complete len:123 (-) Transcript_92961:1109-1477(-)
MQADRCVVVARRLPGNTEDYYIADSFGVVMAPAAVDVGSSQDNDFVLHLSHLHQYLDHNYLPCCWGLFRLKDNHDHYIDWMADTAVAAAVTGNMLDVDVEAAYDPYTTSSDYHIGTAADTAA